MSIHHESHRARRSREQSLAALLLFAVMLCVAIAGVVLALLFIPNPQLLFQQPASGPVPNRLVAEELAGVQLNLPEQLIARVDRTLLGGGRKIDLRIPWPYDPAVLTQAQAPATDVSDFVLITLEARGAQQTHEALLDPVYRVYFTDRNARGAALVAHRFRADAPYADSELLVDYRERPPAAMRCDLKPSVLGPVLCDRLLIPAASLIARIRFSREHVKEWRDIDRLAKALLESIVQQ